MQRACKGEERIGENPVRTMIVQSAAVRTAVEVSVRNVMSEKGGVLDASIGGVF